MQSFIPAYDLDGKYLKANALAGPSVYTKGLRCWIGGGLSPAMWGDHFSISSGASWPSSAECMLCLEVFLWAAEQELCFG